LAVLAVLALMAALGGVWYFVTARPAAGSAVRPAAASSAGQPVGLAQVSGPAAAQLDGWPTAGPSEPQAKAASSDVPIVVDVVGKVAAPGVVELPAHARIRDAIDAAGGALPGVDLTALDLASRLSDGQEIFVGIPVPSGAGAQAAGGVVGGEGASGSGGSDPSGTDAGGGSSSGVVDLNAASLTDLETLPGVGPVLAQHILDWRLQHGNFASVSQLQQVSGIGPAKYAALVSRVHV